MPRLDIVYLRTIFDDYSFSHSRDTVGAHQYLNGSRDLTTPLTRMTCHLWDRTCCDQPDYQIWSFYLHPLCGYDKGYKMWKI